jgi:hypothetical protein
MKKEKQEKDKLKGEQKNAKEEKKVALTVT